MKSLLLAVAIILLAAAGAGRAAAQTRQAPAPNIPFVVPGGVDHKEAPAGAVIQITLNPFDLKALRNFRLKIGGHEVNFTVLEGATATEPKVATIADEPKVAAVVPTLQRVKDSNSPEPVPIQFFNDQDKGGRVFGESGEFRVIPSSDKGYSAQIVSVQRQPNGRYYDVRFAADIPTELWGNVKISIDDRPIVRIVRMLPRVFSFELPPDLPQGNRHEAYVVINNVRSDTLLLDHNFETLVVTTSPTPILQPMQAPAVYSSSALVLVVALVAALAVLGGVLTSLYFYRKAKLNAAKAAEAELSSGEELEEDLLLPEELPPALVTACAAGECVLYAGAGLSAAAGLPTWGQFVLGLIKWALDTGILNESEADAYRVDLRRGQADPVADNIVSRIRSVTDREHLNKYLREVYLKRTSPSSFHSHLRRIRFSAVLTTNFDNILEDIYRAPAASVYTPKDSDLLLAALTRRDFFVLKLYGKLEEPNTVMIAPAQFEEEVAGDTRFSRFMQTLFFSRTLLFVGASLEGIEAYLRGINFQRDSARRHYALVGITDVGWRSKASFLERRYGIEVLPYTPKDGYGELDRFLRELSMAVTESPPADADAKKDKVGLEQVTLKNIGPFDRLELSFDLDAGPDDGKWNIFLGDNGVGKSTVLKAIAFALCGGRAQPYAARLLKVGSENGSITLKTGGGTTYVTNIERKKSGEVMIVGAGGENEVLPLAAQGWLAIGFPPLRTTSWKPLEGPDADFKIRSAPEVEDLLPLIAGDVDPRLDKLKQWIVHLDYQNGGSVENEGRYQGIIQKVFDIIGSMAEGMKVNYKGVDKSVPNQIKILIETDDGTSIPLESLSQGTISLLGWVGILTQRLSEVYDQDTDPTGRYALVLMDEIDAHMHPLWQRKLFTHLKDAFPNAQFIVTTHSPLVVSGMSANQVVRFARDRQGKAVILPIAPDVTFGYTDQVLTSLLFGLPTTLDPITEKKKADYYNLKMKEGGDQEPQYEKLKQELMARIPPPSHDYEEKHRKQKEEADMLTHLGEKLTRTSPEEGRVLLDRADQLRKMIGE